MSSIDAYSEIERFKNYAPKDRDVPPAYNKAGSFWRIYKNTHNVCFDEVSPE